MEPYDDVALVEAYPKTGRTHQIACLAFISHPVVGDTVYRRRKQRIKQRHFLHAAAITFRHPETGEPVTVERAPISGRAAQAAALTPQYGRCAKDACRTGVWRYSTAPGAGITIDANLRSSRTRRPHA